MTKKTPEEILKSIETSSIDDELERVLAMSPAERDAELVAAGYDLKALDAQADALRPKPPVIQAAPRFRPRALLLLAAALSALVSVAVSIPTALLVARSVVESSPRQAAPAAPPSAAALPAAPTPPEVATLRHEDTVAPSPTARDAGARSYDTKMPPEPPRRPKRP